MAKQTAPRRRDLERMEAPRPWCYLRHMETWLVEDDPRLRAGLASALERAGKSFRVTSFDSGAACLRAVDSGAPLDIGLIDLGLPDMTGIELIRHILARRPNVPLIALTVRFDDAAIFGALASGAVGYLLKDVSPAALVNAVEEAVAGGSPLSASVARRLVRQMQPDPASRAVFSLTEREQQVLEELCSGASYREVAGRLGVTEGTVHTHVKRVYDKLGATSKAEAVRIALDARLVSLRHN